MEKEYAEDEEMAMEVFTKGIDDGNQVVFRVWGENQDPNTHIPVAEIRRTIENNTARVLWKPQIQIQGSLPETDPKYFFTVHCAWCPYKRSDNIVIKLRRPEITDPVIVDKDQNPINKGLLGEKLYARVTCNADVKEGEIVDFLFFHEDDIKGQCKPVYDTQAKNIGGFAVAEWEYQYRHNPDKPLVKKPKVYFVAQSARTKIIQSEPIEIDKVIDILVCDLSGECLAELDYTILGKDKTEVKGKTTADGRIYTTDILPGGYEFTFDLKTYKKPDTEPKVIDLNNPAEHENRILVYFDGKPRPSNATEASTFLFVIDKAMDVSSQ